MSQNREANHVVLHHTASTEPADPRTIASAAGLAALASYSAHRAAGGTYALVGTEVALADRAPSLLGDGYVVIGTFVDDAAGKSYVILER